MFVSHMRLFVFTAASWTVIGSLGFAQSGAAAAGGAAPAAAPGGVATSAAPGGATPAVSPGGALPSVAPGNVPQAAPGALPPQAAPGLVPPQAAPGFGPAFIPSAGNGRQGGRNTAAGANNSGTTNTATPGATAQPINVGSTSAQPAAAATVAGQSNAAAAMPNAGGFNGTPTSMGLNFTTEGNGLQLCGIAGSSLAQQSGLQAGDSIVGVNGQTVNSQAQMQAAMRRAFSDGTPLSFSIRRNGQIQSIGVPLPSTMMATGASGTAATAFSGFSNGVSFSSGVAGNGTNAGGTNGLQVSQMTPNGWAAEAGLQVTDRIVGVNGQPVDSDLRMSSLLQSALEQNSSTQLMVNRNGVLTPLTVNRPAGFASGQAAATPMVTGNFSTDFGRWAGDFSQSVQQAQQTSQQQFQQLGQFNDRITTLRGLIMSSTGQSADNVRILEQLRSLQGDLQTYNAQTGGMMQPQIQEFLTRLDGLRPSFTPAAASAPTAAATAGRSSTAPVPATAGATGTGARR